MVQSTIVAEGSVGTTFSGSRTYNRAIRTYKILYEAFHRIFMDDFEFGYPTECSKVREIGSTGEDELVQGCITMLSSKDFHNSCMDLITFKEQLAKGSDLARFWFSFLDILEIFLNLIYATQSGNWDMYVESLRKRLPWFFAYDRQIYSRFLATHFQ